LKYAHALFEREKCAEVDSAVSCEGDTMM